MTNNDNNKKTNPLPKMPPMNFGRGMPSIFSKGGRVSQKGSPQGKFNQSTFHTQHKGGPAGSGK
jgi:hypothetical protein